ncbi:MAG TPA: hypothetical protein VE980_07435 [Pyrinomonadaceae bacterium]|nr:hypothetical protein [Pyrinomonadaceae bacterium]
MKHVGLLLGSLILIASSALHATAQQLVAEPLKVTTPALDARRSLTHQTIVEIENITNKPIEYLTIEVKLPGVTAPFMLAYGAQPGKSAANGVKALQPGAKINLSVDQHACELTQKRLLAVKARSRAGNHATTMINGVLFNDQTAWFDGLPHVMEPNNPLQWNVVQDTSQNDSPMFSFLKAGFWKDNNASPDLCWKRTGTQFVDCCGLQQASAIMVQVFGGILEPFQMETECCSWTKAVGCSTEP